ncbi:head GIN domain-containing protein [Aquimarina sp. AU474]|uniref:head GIN domain-containing protein n=1 Tax=Aquimarina sp. AU474 TaxID=2108529 RepID=UPI000D68B5C0|nr:head GIN domain-containing protein [Aquimarina sp. AU474]
MVRISTYIVTFIICIVSLISGHSQEVIDVAHFDKVIISPHIQVKFIEGNRESVVIENSKLAREKINIENEGKTLRVYLDGAKMITKNVKADHSKWNNQRKSLYKGTQVTAIVYYKDIKELSIRGEEVILCESPMKSDDFKLKIYGESKIIMNSLEAESFQVSMYGESYLEIKDGVVGTQKYTVYGEGEVNSLGLNNENTKITAYGEGNFRINVSDNLKVTAYGEANVAYNGDPSINKGIIIGKARIQKMN